MKTSALGSSVKVDVDRIADFVIFAQQRCILDLSTSLNGGNVSFPQFFLLAYLFSEDHLTMSDIARKVGHSTAAATGLVDRLERLGYVKRFHAAEDRRSIMVRITAKGGELVARMRKEIASRLADILGDMDEDESLRTLPLAELEDLVKRLREENASLRKGAAPATTRQAMVSRLPTADARTSGASANAYPNLNVASC